MDHFSHCHQTTPSKSLDRRLTSPILTGYKQVVLQALFLSSTTFCVCLLLLPCQFCHSYHVFFCYMSCVHAYPPRYERQGLLGLHHFLLFPYGLGWCVGKSPCSPNLLGFYSYCFLFLPYMWLASCHFCHVGPLALLPFYLGFPCPFALLLPLVVPMGLLAIIPTMLAHWAYYLLP